VPPSYEEFSVKTLMTKGFFTDMEIKNYFPSLKWSRVDRQFAWDMFKALKGKKAEAYY